MTTPDDEHAWIVQYWLAFDAMAAQLGEPVPTAPHLHFYLTLL